jgi:hypothetical protein
MVSAIKAEAQDGLEGGGLGCGREGFQALPERLLHLLEGHRANASLDIVDGRRESPGDSGILRPMTRLTDVVCLLLLGESEVFLGSTFPINEAYQLYLGAAHSIDPIPAEKQSELRIMAFTGSGPESSAVRAVEVLAAHPDVIVMQADDGMPPWKRLAADEAFVWEQVCAVGYPEMDIRDLEPGKRTADVRGLVGSVTRKVEAGQTLNVKASAYEVSFAIPNGMSGGPVFSGNVGAPLGLIGVCLGNVTAYSTLFDETIETSDGELKTTRESRIIEYGLVANLGRWADESIGLVGKSLRQLMGSEAGATSSGWSNPIPPEG